MKQGISSPVFLWIILALYFVCCEGEENKEIYENTLSKTWYQTDIIQDDWIWNISVVNDDIVWIIDSDEDSISITTDGGISWTSKALPVPEGYIRAAGGICALSALKAYFILCISDLKGIYLTTNGGNNWIKQTTAFDVNSDFPDVIHFWNDNEGVAIGDAAPDFEIYTTTNGGVQWNRVPSENMPAGNSEGTWNTQQTFKIIGNSIFFMTSGKRIFKSLDKGNTWSAVNTPFYNTAINGSDINFDFKDSNNGLISYYSSAGSSNKIYSTDDGGQNWSIIETVNFYQNLKYIPTANCYLSMNPQKGLSFSTDNGKTWIIVNDFKDIPLTEASYSSSGKIFLGGLKYIYYSD